MRLPLLILALALFSMPGFASTLNYSEYPDFPSSGFPLLGTLDVGMNTVSGSLIQDSGHDIDTFSLTTAPGTEVISEEIDFTYTHFGTGVSITEPIDGTTAIASDIDTTLTPATPITGLFDVEVQGTNINPVCSGPGGTPPCNFVPVFYTLTYNVQNIPGPAPEPSSAALCATGVGLFGLVMMWKRRLAMC